MSSYLRTAGDGPFSYSRTIVSATGRSMHHAGARAFRPYPDASGCSSHPCDDGIALHQRVNKVFDPARHQLHRNVLIGSS